MFIDVQAHAYRDGMPPQDGRTVFCTPAQLIARYDELGIERGVVMPLIGPETYLTQSNEDILDFAEQSGGRLIPFCNIDPRGMTNAPNARLDIWLRHYKGRGCKGVGEVMPNLPFLDPRVQNLFGHVEAVGLPLTFDISDRIGGDYGLYDDAGLPQLEESLKRFPNLKIFGHGPAFWAEIAELKDCDNRNRYPKRAVEKEGVVPRLLRERPNLYGDLSAGSGFNALNRDHDYAVAFLNEFQDKLMFGTDLCSPTQEVHLINFLIRLREEGSISESVFRKVARENAIRLLDL